MASIRGALASTIRLAVLGWRPKLNTVYRAWYGDSQGGRRSVTVEAVIDGVRYPATFKVYRAAGAGTDDRLEECEVFVLPVEYQQIQAFGRIPESFMAHAFRFTIERRLARIQKKTMSETVVPVQGGLARFVKFRSVRYIVTVKEMNPDVQMRFAAWLDSLGSGGLEAVKAATGSPA
jgi:hypothetical protein